MNKQGTENKSKTAAVKKPVARKLKAKVEKVKKEPEEVVVVEEILNKSSQVLKGPKAGPSKFSSAAANPAVQGATAAVECNGVRKQVKRKLNEVVVDEGRKKSRMVAEATSTCVPAVVHPAPPAAQPHSGSGEPVPVHDQISETEMHQLVEKAMRNVQDIDELLKSQQTERMDCQSLLAAPAMISEGTPGKFRSLNFYWLQILEGPDEVPGSLYMFGKVKTPPPGDGFSSCCIILKDLDRRVYLLPREKKSDGTPVDFMDVYHEFKATICPKYGITAFKAQRATTKYRFDIQAVSPEAEYVEICCSESLSRLPDDLNGETFSHAFVTFDFLEETFMADKKLKAPSWLRTFCWQQVQPDQQLSRCKFEFTCDGSSFEIHPDNSTFPTPRLVLASISLQGFDDDRIVFAGIAVNRNFHLESPLAAHAIFQDYFGLFAKPPGQNWRLAQELAGNERIVEMESEQQLIERLIEKLENLDADIFLVFVDSNYLDYSPYELDFQLLLRRIRDLKIKNSSGIGRLRLEKPLGSQVAMPNIHRTFPGRLILDMAVIYERCFFNPFSYSLSLRMPSKEHAPTDIFGDEKILSHSPQGFSALVKRGLYGCVRNIKTINELEAIPLAFQISGIVGASCCKSLYDAVEIIPSSFLNIFFTKDYVQSESYWGEFWTDKYMDGSGRKEDAIASKGGFCENYVLRLNFQRESIQRSALLQEYMAKEDNGSNEEEPRCAMRDDVRKLVQRWKEVKRTLVANNLTEVEMQKNNILLKALAWAMEVIIKGFPPIDSTDRDKAKSHALILKLGETLRAVDVELVLGFEDTVVVDTQSQDYSTVVEINRKVVDEISRTHPLLLVTKGGIQCFSLFNMDSRKWLSLSQYTKDVAPFVADMAHACFHEILCDQSDLDIRSKVGNILQKEVAKLRDGTIELEKLLLTKTLSKDPKEYEKGAQEELEDHVRVALRMNKYGKLQEKFRKGDKISYLVGINGHLYHSSEITGGLKFNEQFYWDQITHPIVGRILKIIAGSDGDKLADELGFGPSASNDPK